MTEPQSDTAFPALPDIPLVSVFSTTYNHERFIGQCIESVLSQGWPPDRLQYVLVDDGSTDGTPDVIARYASDLTVTRQENQGLRAAVNRSISELVGDVILPVSGDDMLAPGRIATAVEFLRAHPDVGWCYGEVEVIDDDDVLMSRSLAEMYGLPAYEGHVAGKLVINNFINGGALTFRGSLKSAIYPIPQYAGWEDWWWAYRLSLASRGLRLPAVVYRYRQHRTNLSLGVTGARLARLHVEEQRFRLWMLANTPRDQLPMEDALAAIERFFSLQEGIAAELSGEDEPLLPTLSEHDARRAEDFAQGAERLLASGSTDAAAWLAIRAFALNPAGARGRAVVGEATRAWQTPAAQRTRQLRAALGARRFVVVADLADLATASELLEALRQTFDNTSDASLWVVTSSAAERAGRQLRELLTAAWPDESRWPDVHLHPSLSEATIAELAHSADYTLSAEGVGTGDLPDGLRDRAALVRTAYETDVPLGWNG